MTLVLSILLSLIIAGPALAQQVFNPVEESAGADRAPNDATYWTGGPSGDLTSEHDLSGFTGLVLNSSGTPSAYGGASCTNQVLRLLNASGAGTCITITSAYIDSSIVPSTRNVNTTAPLSGGGALSGDLTLTTSMATSRLIGRLTAGSGVMEELTGTQATTLLDVFTDVLKGLAPASGGGTTNFLRADGTWAAPAGGGSHALLSATHTDTLADTVVRGDILRGNATPAWARLALGGANLYLKSNGTDLLYSTLAAGGVGSCTNQFVTALNADAAPTCTTATLASAQFANQGTTTTVLHGNAAGNPSFASVTGSDFASQTANFFFAAPNGAGGTPTFRAIVDDDVPNTITLTNLTQIGTRQFSDTTGTVGVGRGGTGRTTITTNQVYVGTALDTLTAKTLPSCSNTTTEKLLYNNSTQEFSCGTDQSAAGSSWTTTEIDFGVRSTWNKVATVVDGGVSGTSKIIVVQAGTAATGKQSDDNEMEQINCNGIPGTGQFTLNCTAQRTVTHGAFKVHYLVN